MIEAMGDYPVTAQMELLDSLKLYAEAVLFLGLVFSVINILFVTISTLLIYSLLMASVETKWFDNSVLRLVGLSKFSFIAMIFLQSVIFVLPSIVLAFAAIIPTLMILFGILFSADMGF